MSSEPSREPAAAPAASPRAAAARARELAARSAFRRGLLVATAVLVGAVAILAVLGALAPPRVSAVSVDAAAATSRPGQRLAIELSQPASAEGATLTVTPAADAELAIDGATATVRFTGMLDYATEYTVRIVGLHGAATGAEGSVETSFVTPDPGIVTLVRGDDGDRLVRSPIDGGEATTIAEAPAIGDVAVAGATVAMSVDDGDGARVRILVPDAEPVEAHGPYEASIRALRGTEAGVFGWIISRGVDGTRDYANTLVVYDLAGESARTNVPVEITLPDGAPLTAVDWAWVPGTTSLVVQDQDGFTWLASAIGGEPQLLGAWGTLRGFIPGTASLLTEDGADLLVTDLTTGTSTPFGLTPPVVPDDDIVGESAVLSSDATAWIVHHFDRTRSPSLTGSALVRVDDGGTGVGTELYRTSGDASIILDLCVSPNGQYVAATVTDVGAVAARPTTVLVDARAGGTRRSVPGGSIEWCD